MNTNIHTITLIINNEEADIWSQDNLNLRMNNQLFNPTEISTNTAEYSFSFSLPITPNNCRIFGYANNLSKLNKFNKQYPSVVYADGNEIFNGVLRLSSITKKDFKCNLVNVKINKINDIFGDAKLSDLRWDVDFDGTTTINSVNNDMSSDYYFPLVCYGVFQKRPKGEHLSSFDRYTPKHTLDEYNLWYYESFAPSIKLNSLVKKLFEYKGYNVGGDIFDDENINNIYLSESIADKQDPLYNIGSDLGKCEVNFTFNNWDKIHNERLNNVNRMVQTLMYPHEKIGDYHNFDTIFNYDIWSEESKYLTINNSPNKYMWRSNCIAIPADGLYKIEFDARISIADAYEKMNAYKYDNVSSGRYPEYQEVLGEVKKSWDNYPIELHLLRNEHDTEMIFGVNEDGNMYPHETNEALVKHYNNGKNEHIWYIAKKGEPIAYDMKANSNFICGFSSISESTSYIKNGMSWDGTISGENISRYNLTGYSKKIRTSTPSGRGTTWDERYENTDYNSNSLIGVKGNYFSSDGTWSKKGKISMVISLKKNDILRLKAVTRCYKTNVGGSRPSQQYNLYDDYRISIGGNIKVEAYSPKYEQYGNDTDLGWSTIPVKDMFQSKLNLGNFLNNQIKMSDFIENYQKALNLSYRMEGNTVFFDRQYNDNITPMAFIDIDDRVNSSDAESYRIEYPSSMEIKYSIDDEEHGFYISVPNDKIELPQWKDYADVGSDKIKLTDDEDAQDETIDLSNSYCWYDSFQYQSYNQTTKAKEGISTLYLPVISKDEYMIEGYKYEESMKHDGKSLKQRWWFRQPVTDKVLKMWNDDIYNITIPTNIFNNTVLSYKNENGSLLNKYFNVNANPDSNLVKINVYLSPKEYKSIKNGALVKFDNDLYIPTEIQGFDPTANNMTELTLLKKI